MSQGNIYIQDIIIRGSQRNNEVLRDMQIFARSPAWMLVLKQWYIDGEPCVTEELSLSRFMNYFDDDEGVKETLITELITSGLEFRVVRQSVTWRGGDNE